ncbi:hypothetical protein ACH5RR_002780 [Cinchona calisaya]|uniref:Reverse transcriptase domain-containing protein n=1 Tax=Cinchona calisaya TaxID=153742 RepID=A0ABD3ATI2_9GENT
MIMTSLDNISLEKPTLLFCGFPYSFIQAISREVEAKRWTLYLSGEAKGPYLSHFIFADDVILFSSTNKKSIKAVKEVAAPSYYSTADCTRPKVKFIRVCERESGTVMVVVIFVVHAGTTPSTVSNKEWWEETDKKFQAWPRTAGPPVVMNPISRQNFIVKNRIDQ